MQHAYGLQTRFEHLKKNHKQLYTRHKEANLSKSVSIFITKWARWSTLSSNLQEVDECNEHLLKQQPTCHKPQNFATKDKLVPYPKCQRGSNVFSSSRVGTCHLPHIWCTASPKKYTLYWWKGERGLLNSAPWWNWLFWGMWGLYPTGFQTLGFEGSCNHCSLLIFTFSEKTIVNSPIFSSDPFFPARNTRLVLWKEKTPFVRRTMSPGLKNSHSWPQSCRWTAAVASATKATDTTGPASPIRERAPFSSTMNVRLRLAAAEGLKSCFQMQAQHVSIEEMSATFHVKHKWPQ